MENHFINAACCGSHYGEAWSEQDEKVVSLDQASSWTNLSGQQMSQSSPFPSCVLSIFPQAMFPWAAGCPLGHSCTSFTYFL